MDPTIPLWALAALLVLLGIGGLVLPALPGAPILFGGLVLAAWAEDFAYVGWGWLSLIGGLAVLTYVVDFAATALGAKRFGASRRSVIGATVGAIVGIFFGIPGILLGPFIGAVLGELSAQRTLPEAGRAGLGAALGLAAGIAVKLTLAFAMVGVFALVRFF